MSTPVTDEMAINILKAPTPIQKVEGKFITIKPEYRELYNEQDILNLRDGKALPKSKVHVSGACAMGLVGLKTGTIPSQLPISTYDAAINFNDETAEATFSDIAEKLETYLKEPREEYSYDDDYYYDDEDYENDPW